MAIRTWGIIGTGLMGRGISELVASKGFDVIVVGHTPAELEAARQSLDLSLQHQIEHWAITEAEKKVTMARVQYTTDLTQLAHADFVLHALIADLEEDKQIFRTLDQICRKDVILASNTSTLSITEIAAATYRPDRVIGCHYVTPYTKTRVVEIVRGLKTSDSTVAEVKALVEALDRTGVEVYEATGYVTTRLIVPLINEACAVLMEGVATADDIDTAMRLGFEMARGPLETADQIGLDTVLIMCERLWREYGEVRYRPSRILKKLVRAGQLGVATGEGFFKYDKNGHRIKNGGAR
ncbi:MAG TPA: 3-hydroxyacyl-CoA dehydrogenase NAD-binding domain-containing protein [Symbiobacteriaceae bacterium]|nr:3-hydroxyacyl-CoA dehydrogenase NAD-binding domain-containing protein [Symbiobacteriaceae bacterium]